MKSKKEEEDLTYHQLKYCSEHHFISSADNRKITVLLNTFTERRWRNIRSSKESDCPSQLRFGNQQLG